MKMQYKLEVEIADRIEKLYALKEQPSDMNYEIRKLLNGAFLEIQESTRNEAKKYMQESIEKYETFIMKG